MQGCIDYILHDEIHFITTRFLQQLDDVWYTKYRALPNKWCPSDHILLAAEIEWNNVIPSTCEEYSLIVKMHSSARSIDETSAEEEIGK